MKKETENRGAYESTNTLTPPAATLNGNADSNERNATSGNNSTRLTAGRRKNACGELITDCGTENAAGSDAPDLEKFLCPVDEAARIVGQKWTLQIVHHLLDGHPRRFCELQDALGKVNPSTLSSRLKMLEEVGLVSRSQISDIPPHVEYRLTDMGSELRGVIVEITRWSNAHLCRTSRAGTPSTSEASPQLQPELAGRV